MMSRFPSIMLSVISALHVSCAIAELQTVPHKLIKSSFLLFAVDIIGTVLCCYGLSRKHRIW